MFKRFTLSVFVLVFLAGMPLSVMAATADMGVTITGNVGYQAGNKRTVTITVTNAGPNISPQINYITMPLPPAPITVTNILTSGTVTPLFVFPNNGGVLQVNYGDFPSGGTAIVIFDENAPAGTAIPTNYTDTVTINHTTPVTDPNPGNDSASLPGSVVGNSDVSVTYTSGAGTTTGQPRTLKITVSNAGPASAGLVVLTQNPAPNTSFVSFVQNSGPAFTASGTPTNKFSIGALASAPAATS